MPLTFTDRTEHEMTRRARDRLSRLRPFLFLAASAGVASAVIHSAHVTDRLAADRGTPGAVGVVFDLAQRPESQISGESIFVDHLTNLIRLDDVELSWTVTVGTRDREHVAVLNGSTDITERGKRWGWG